jgi:hypothetical protein
MSELARAGLGSRGTFREMLDQVLMRDTAPGGG